MFPDLSQVYDSTSATLTGGNRVERRLSDLAGCFQDEAAWKALVEESDPLLYAVTAVEPENHAGGLHYGLGVLYPGRVGEEYVMTKGHLHTWRDAAEVYIGLRGEGAMLLEDWESGESRLEPLRANSIVYVPGNTAHRTINVGSEPLVYIGVYPAQAGHDYAAIAQRNFRKIVVSRDGAPSLQDR